MEPVDRIVELEERLAYAEVARDNALAMRDEAQERLKEHRKNAGRMIGALREIVLFLMKEARPESAKLAEERMRLVLDAKRGD